jgi:hypothetical protein
MRIKTGRSRGVASKSSAHHVGAGGAAEDEEDDRDDVLNDEDADGDTAVERIQFPSRFQTFRR